jgi:hypothetical protein
MPGCPKRNLRASPDQAARSGADPIPVAPVARPTPSRHTAPEYAFNSANGVGQNPYSFNSATNAIRIRAGTGSRRWRHRSKPHSLPRSATAPLSPNARAELALVDGDRRRKFVRCAACQQLSWLEGEKTSKMYGVSGVPFLHVVQEITPAPPPTPFLARSQEITPAPPPPSFLADPFSRRRIKPRPLFSPVGGTI